MTQFDDYSHLDDETRRLLEQAETRVGHADLGYSDMGEIEGRHDFYEYMQKKDSGYKLPFPALDKQFLIAPNELTLISGYTGTGKTELVNQILLDCIAQGAKGVITSLELTTNQLKKRLYQQSTGLATQTKQQNDQFHDFYAGRLKYWNGKKMQKVVQLLAMMKKFHIEDKCDVFVLDNMMMLGAKPDEYNKQYETVFLLKEFCKSYPVHVFLVAHPRKPREKYQFEREKNPPPVYFDTPNIYDVSGSATIANLVDNYLGLGLNIVKDQAQKEIDAQRFTKVECREILSHADVKLRRGKRREHGKNFDHELFFDVNFRRFKESFTEKLKPYLELK